MTAFESRRADTIRPGDIIHTRGGVRTALAVNASQRMVTVTVTDNVLGERPLMYAPTDLVHTERVPR